MRHTVACGRERLEAAIALAELYWSLRPFRDFLQPSFKLKEKSRDGAKFTSAGEATPTADIHERRPPRASVAGI